MPKAIGTVAGFLLYLQSHFINNSNMENELWNKLEIFVGTPMLNMIIPHYMSYIQEQLTPEQLEPLGDLTSMLTEKFSVKCDTPAKEFIEAFIYLAKLGVIKKKS